MHRLLSALAAGCCAVAVAACGSSAKAPGGGSGSKAAQGRSAFLAFSDCMRSHGVPNFPDPSSSGGIQISTSIASSPAFRGAQQQCQKLLPGGGPRQASPSDGPRMLALAECMRRHGVTNFPDPVAFHGSGPPSGPAIVINGYEFKLSAGLNPMSPAFQNAMKACGGPGPP